MALIAAKRTARLGRMINLAAFLTNNSGIKAETVCEVFGISRGELVSLLNDMLMCGVPPYGPSDYISAWIDGDKVTISNAYWLRKAMDLSTEEAVSLKLMIGNVVRQSPDLFEEAAQSLEEKMAVFLGHKVAPRAAGSSRSERYDTLRRAIEDRQAVEITYYSRTPDEVTDRVVEPLALANIGGLWCLGAYCRYSRKETLFAFERISSVRPTLERFRRSANAPGYHGPHRLVERSRHRQSASRIKVTFDPNRARWAIEQFDEAKVEHLPDGSVACTFAVVDAAWIADIVAEFAGSALVEGPDRYHRAFLDRLLSIETLYRGDGKGRRVSRETENES